MPAFICWVHNIERLNKSNEKGDTHSTLYNTVILYVHLRKAGDWQIRMGKKNTYARNKEIMYQEIGETKKRHLRQQS